MNFFKKLTGWALSNDSEKKNKQDHYRQCRIESLEDRRVLSADPVVAGITYQEGDSGSDSTPDQFVVTFQGGSSTTKLTEIKLNGDQDGNGSRSLGDMIFHANSNISGAGQFHGFQFNASGSSGITASDIESVTVSDDGLSLSIKVKNFEAGDKLSFTIDVDEIEKNSPDRIASGIEFESTGFQAVFADQHNTFTARNVSVPGNKSSGQFWDEYDGAFTTANGLINGGSLNLPADAANQAPDRSAGAFAVYDLSPKPVTISGTVFHDTNTNNTQDSGETGIKDVTLKLQIFNTTTNKYEDVGTTKTDANGDYEFGASLNLQPGKYRVIETQPDGYLSVGSKVGTVDSTSTGTGSNDSSGQPNILGEITIPKGGQAAIDYDFAEVKQVSLSGHVYHDANNNGIKDSGESGIANVQVRIRRTGGVGTGTDPFSSQQDITLTTDANGFYQANGLAPGQYEIVEINTYSGTNPLAGFLDGKDAVGTVAGQSRGTLGNDKFTAINLAAGENSIQNNFGEVRPVSIAGFVSQADKDGNCTRPGQTGYKGIAGVTIQVFDANGTKVREVTTDSEGKYKVEGLPPGTYKLVQIQPSDFLDGSVMVGNVGGTTNGSTTVANEIANITLHSGNNGVQYGFCEHKAASIAGTVYEDSNNNGVKDAGEAGIAGATVKLLNADGTPVMVNSGGTMVALQVVTDSNGNYKFENLKAGEYRIMEVQPSGYHDGIDTIGSHGGEKSNDLFTKVNVKYGDAAVNYNFGEFKLATIEGHTLVDSNNNCILDHADDKGIQGVTIQLLDSNGNVVQTTTTDANGKYEFKNIIPGHYQVRQLQPSGYFTKSEKIGNQEGQTGIIGKSVENRIYDIEVKSNFKLVQYNFCETPVAEISGIVFQDGPDFQTQNGLVPANYLSQRDGQFTGDDTAISGVRMTLYWYVDPSSQSIAPRPVKLSEVDASFYPELAGNPDAPISVTTDANGRYSFKGLKAGNYIVLQEQPAGYVDSIDTVGTTTGQTFNTPGSTQTASGNLISTLGATKLQDAVVNIRVNAGQVSSSNNFSEVKAIPRGPETPQIPQTPQTPTNPTLPEIPTTGFGGLAGQQSVSQNVQIGIGFTAAPETATNNYTWHLSVINGGSPREASGGVDSRWQEVAFLTESQWTQFQTDQGLWSFASEDADKTYELTGNEIRFGTEDGRPVVGDFNGDGRDEIGIYNNGYWLADLNGNGKWDDNDLMAQLGNQDDQPVVGDWDGDGKDDIGIYGPIWKGDEIAIIREHGLPDRDNTSATEPKNIPPKSEEAAEGSRILKAGRRIQPTADVIDHVFGYGSESDIAFVADLNGDGIPTIGLYNSGTWRFDTNGDGQFNSSDSNFKFGQAGDIPVVGDFDGDGVDEVAVYRNGKWIVDSNGNQELDASDRVFEMKGEGYPMVGDFDGDGKDEPVFYKKEQFEDIREAG